MHRPTFTAPPPDPEPPAVDAFLSAADRVMNGNTLLLTASCDIPVTVGNRQVVLHAFLRDAVFEQRTRAADRHRGWFNLGDEDGERPPQRPLARADFDATLHPLDHAGFLDRLRWMLREAFSPYHGHYPAAEAEPLVHDFARALLGTDGPSWSFAAISPDFLRDSGYHTGEEPQEPVYFDGGASDTATLVHRHHTLHLLLTNGSP
ncbi:hypothetical protein E0L36_24625 [Streptomyces sp. AJS327]|uniref:hypothetical protein n=1 Tax=Streptomyces sp. AJS327 TaxID=2545265 RepID=UPI0015DE3989|nr:hypothetical protein [Streptomyces sp. AJS327]MBA0053920.1 hypothetical protein [Streptomyces sp. AJS327]